jgi:hypothetical protein
MVQVDMSEYMEDALGRAPHCAPPSMSRCPIAPLE